jgi:2,3-bisphosphoglycerate-dependent phosphoglycerate mutase
MWNEKNLFTGCCDVPLTKRGVEEAIEAGKRISYIPVDLIFTSGLIRAKMTAMLAMTQHQEKKVLIPFIVKVTRSERIDSLCQKSLCHN